MMPKPPFDAFVGGAWRQRLEADDGELDPTEFVETLVRLAAWRYTKGSLAVRAGQIHAEDAPHSNRVGVRSPALDVRCGDVLCRPRPKERAPNSPRRRP